MKKLYADVKIFEDGKEHVINEDVRAKSYPSG